MQRWCDHLPETPSFLQQLPFINIHVVSCELRSFLGSNQHFHPPFSVTSGFTAQPLECPHPAPVVFGSRSIPVTCSGKQTLQHWAYPQYSLQYWAPLHRWCVICSELTNSLQSYLDVQCWVVTLYSPLMQQTADIFIPEWTKKLGMVIIKYILWRRIDFYPSLHPKMLVKCNVQHVFDT